MEFNALVYRKKLTTKTTKRTFHAFICSSCPLCPSWLKLSFQVREINEPDCSKIRRHQCRQCGKDSCGGAACDSRAAKWQPSGDGRERNGSPDRCAGGP